VLILICLSLPHLREHATGNVLFLWFITARAATAKQHTTETRMEVIIIRRLLGTMIATFLLHSDCICRATSFILAHGSGKNVDHFLHGRVFHSTSAFAVHCPPCF